MQPFSDAAAESFGSGSSVGSRLPRAPPAKGNCKQELSNYCLIEKKRLYGNDEYLNNKIVLKFTVFVSPFSLSISILILDYGCHMGPNTLGLGLTCLLGLGEDRALPRSLPTARSTRSHYVKKGL